MKTLVIKKNILNITKFKDDQILWKYPR